MLLVSVFVDPSLLPVYQYSAGVDFPEAQSDHLSEPCETLQAHLMSAATVENDQTEDLTTWNLSDYSLYHEMSSTAYRTH